MRMYPRPTSHVLISPSLRTPLSSPVGRSSLDVLLLSIYSPSAFRPVQVLVQEIERSLAVDRVRADEPFDLATVREAQLRRVQVADLGELVADRLVRGDAVEVAALHHERPRCDQGGHLGVVERAAQ